MMAMAVGLSCVRENVKAVREAMNAYAREHLGDAQRCQRIQTVRPLREPLHEQVLGLLQKEFACLLTRAPATRDRLIHLRWLLRAAWHAGLIRHWSSVVMQPGEVANLVNHGFHKILLI